jgi:uncharacterized iron-regulated protein
MVEFAKLNKLNIVCANAAGRYSNLVSRKGQSALMSLPKASKINFAPLPFDTASGNYYKKLLKLTSHSMPSTNKDTSNKNVSVMPPVTYNLIMGQSLWDATMAYSISEYYKKHKGIKVMQVNGRFHSDEGFAIITQLKKYSPKLKPLIISSGSDESFPNIDWKLYTHLGDYIIITDKNK